MNRLQRKLIKDCLEYPYCLNDWEIGFINNLADQEDNYELTDKQNHRLNVIAQKVEEI